MMRRLLAPAALTLLLTQCDPQCAPEPTTADGTGTPGDCASYQDDMAAVGLPVSTFTYIARRESGCDPHVWVIDRDDNGGAMFGFNFIGSMSGYWKRMCGATPGTIRGNVPLIMECAAAEYQAHGLRAWRT